LFGLSLLHVRTVSTHFSPSAPPRLFNFPDPIRSVVERDIAPFCFQSLPHCPPIDAVCTSFILIILRIAFFIILLFLYLYKLPPRWGVCFPIWDRASDEDANPERPSRADGPLWHGSNDLRRWFNRTPIKPFAFTCFRTLCFTTRGVYPHPPKLFSLPLHSLPCHKVSP
jgi:hypothetical protein